MENSIYDVIIIGGGIMGSSLAYNLMRMDDRLRVLVVERDPTYAKASTTLSMTNARIQFSLKQNIEVSQYAFDVLESFEDEMAVDGERPAISYRREGNLFLFDASGEAAAQEAFELQWFIWRFLGRQCILPKHTRTRPRRRRPGLGRSRAVGRAHGQRQGCPF